MSSLNPACEKCTLSKGAHSVCLAGEGPRNARIMVVGEAPGKDEDRTGRPFVGASGKRLRAELAANGLTEVFITNTVRCRPPDNRKPSAAEMKACREYLDYEIERIKPEIVVSLGATPTKALFKGMAQVSKHHGTIVQDKSKKYQGYVSYHPAAMLYDPGIEPAFKADIARLARTLRGEIKNTEVPWSIVRRGNLHKFLREFRNARVFSFDLETTGLFPHNPDEGGINCVGIGLPGKTWVIPNMGPGWYPHRKDNKRLHWHPGSPWCRGNAFKFLMRMLFGIAEKDKKIVVAQNGKFDNNWLARKVGKKFRLAFDTMLASHTLDENEDHDLKSLSRQYLDVPEYDLTTPEKRGLVDPFKLYEYNARDCGYTLRLRRVQLKALRAEPELERLFFSLVMPAARAMEDIELVGKTIDLEKFEKLALDLKIREINLLLALKKLIGREINWKSAPQIRELMYGEGEGNLGLECTVFTAKGAKSTGEAAIIDLKGKHPIIDKMIEFREVSKFRSTYVVGFRKYMVDDLLYISYKIHGTVTGRYSSRIHSIPRDGSVRNLVTAPSGWRFFQADISQAELRVAAEISGDLEMRRCFKENIDIHLKTVLYQIATGGGSGIELVKETFRLYCLRHKIPSNGASSEVLQEVWNSTKRADSTEKILAEVWKTRSSTYSSFVQEVWRDLPTYRSLSVLLPRLSRNSRRPKISQPEKENRPEVRGRVRRQPDWIEEQSMERRDSSHPSKEVEEKILRALWKYIQLRRASQRSQPKTQSEIQLSDALSFMSSFTPQQAQEIREEWKELRKRLGKSVNFGFVYGMYEKKFILTAKTKYGWEPSWDEAHACREGYFQLYNELPNWHTKQKKLVKLNGYVRTMFGRRRRLPGINSDEKMKRMEAERQAINSPVQGTIGDWKAAVLVEIHETCDREKLRLVGEHHDALLGLIRIGEEAELQKVIDIIRKPKLLNTFKIKIEIPMDGEIEIGPWGKKGNEKFVSKPLPIERKAA